MAHTIRAPWCIFGNPTDDVTGVVKKGSGPGDGRCRCAEVRVGIVLNMRGRDIKYCCGLIFEAPATPALICGAA